MGVQDNRTTTQRGYGWTHQRARLQAIRGMVDGQACTRCGLPMWRAEAHTLHLDHTDDRGGYRGLAHPTCNTRAGQAKSMARRQPRAQPTRSRQW
jgi:hypothetical protein